MTERPRLIDILILFSKFSNFRKLWAGGKSSANTTASFRRLPGLACNTEYIREIAHLRVSLCEVCWCCAVLLLHRLWTVRVFSKFRGSVGWNRPAPCFQDGTHTPAQIVDITKRGTSSRLLLHHGCHNVKYLRCDTGTPQQHPIALWRQSVVAHRTSLHSSKHTVTPHSGSLNASPMVDWLLYCCCSTAAVHSTAPPRIREPDTKHFSEDFRPQYPKEHKNC